MKSLKRYFLMSLLCLLFAACGGPGVCDCDKEAEKEDPDEELLEECRSLLGGMEMDDVLKALKDCD